MTPARKPTFSRLLLMLLALAVCAVPASALAWWQKDWSFRKEITLDASSKGGSILQPAGRVTVLIRLHTGNFKFSDASDKGDDLRFVAEDDKTPLAFHIETFDPLLGVAAIWVDVPEFPVGATKKIWMYYGNKKATPAADSGATFDPDYALVYHFGGPAGAPPTDSTANHINATSAAAGVDESSIIGKGAKFSGAGGVAIPAAPALAAAAGAPFTFSIWAKPTALQPHAALYVRRDGGSVVAVGLDNGTPFVETRGGTGPARLAAPQAVAAGQWTQIAVTSDGKTVLLFVNGHVAASGTGGLPASSGAAMLGADTAGSTEFTGFQGTLDEARISKVARSPTALLVEDSLEGAESRLVSYGEDQKQAGVGFGTLGLIVAHVDPPAWFIIILLSAMAVGSWFVMYIKITEVGRKEKANAAFLDFFHETAGDPLAVYRTTDEEEFDDSTLGRIYQAGAREMARREARGEGEMSEAGVEVVRALMNTRFVRENQALSRYLVVLTIAISGGPFLGLLGTVVGVMITFADVAAAGDVNINAIAPGISAALLATIAGLTVAIPSLFAYNYILLRNKDVSANMLTFVDEFVTQISEHHSKNERGGVDAPPPPGRQRVGAK
jgi:biopolymer transport protein ExbB